MRKLKEINSQLALYKNSEYKWARELYIEFENYFDEYFRDSLKFLNYKEEEMRDMLLFSLDNLYRIISGGEYFVGDQNLSNNFVFSMGWLQHPARKPDIPLNKEIVYKLFIELTFPWRSFIAKQFEMLQKELSLKEYKIKTSKELVETNAKTQYLDDKIKELRGEYENKDRDMENQNAMIVKLRKGIDEKGGIDRLKSLIDKCYKGKDSKKGKASKLEWSEAFAILDREADTCRAKNTYKTLRYNHLGKRLGIHHTTAKRWCLLLGIKKYC